MHDSHGTGVRSAVLIEPYGGRLVDLVVPAEQRDALESAAAALPALHLSERSLCDLELLAAGAFSPLDRFMRSVDYERVLSEMRLSSGCVFPIPVMLPVEPGADLRLDGDVALRDASGQLLAVMTIEEIYRWDWRAVARHVLRTEDPSHPLVRQMQGWAPLSASGPLRVLRLPVRRGFPELRLRPADTRSKLRSLGRAHVVGFQTRNPLHRAHEELIRRAIEAVDGVMLLHPVVGLTKPGDVDHDVRVRTYQAFARQCDPERLVLALLPLAMWLAGPREALWHALIRRNYGATHFIVGRNHASPGVDAAGTPFYGAYEAQDLVSRFSGEIGVTVVPFREMVYVPDEDRYCEESELPPRKTGVSLSGTELREQFLRRGRPLPAWFVRPEVAKILAGAYAPRPASGVCVWFTGLSGAGKSTTAEALAGLLEAHDRQVTLLDGDVVRTHLSKGLGFSREDRDENVRRIGLVASEVVRHGGIALCAVVSPYRAARDEVRSMVGADQFVEVFVDTPLEICERRDSKGMYAKARRGEITQFTAIDDPYEAPLYPEIRLETSTSTVDANARLVLDTLIRRGFIEPSHRDRA